jgi:endogenous inhibitor of DNA gyrase (YacG/DUF329 family)
MTEQDDNQRSRQRACPICGKPAVPGHGTFCSKRCADIDLGRWLKGVYRVPTNEAPGDAEEGGNEPS